MASIVIDNLEDIPEPGLLIKKLSVLRHSEKVRILLSSQETDQIADALSEHFGVERPLLITDHSAADIKRFARSRGAALVESKPQLLEKSDFIMKTLEEKAHGMFQWVNSALEHLRSVEDARDVESKLNGMRQDLIGTYDKIFERLSIGRDEAEVRRIQTALKWIAANATPVTAVDVKVAYMIQEMIYQKNNGVASDEATAKMERDVRSLFEKEESREVAEKEIKKYLGTIVNVSSDGTLNFKHPTIQRALTKPDEVPNPSSKFKFALTDAHHDIALVCMTVCQMTTFIHANSFLDWRVPLVQYAWNFWAYHVKNAKMPFTALKDIDKIKNLLGGYPGISDHLTRHLRFQSAFDKMMDSVTRDALLYLEALMDFMSRPLRAVNGRFSDREYVLSLQRAQDSLIQPTRDLCALRRSLSVPISAQLALVAIDVRAASAQQQACPRTTLSTLGRRASDRVAGAKSVLLGSSTTTVTALSLDSYLATNTTVPRPRGATQLLAEIARNLRLTTLRFAVDPMYSALLLTADGTSFSPLHPIVYLAQLLEEAGRYPYWDALPPGTDLMEPFICASTDPEFPSAKFVLHCFEWRDPRLTTTDVVVSASQKPGSALEHSGGYYVRTAGLHIDLRPSPGTGEPLGLTRVSTENWEQVKRLHEMKASQFFAARGTYALFRSDDEWLNKQVINPLAALHMKFSLVIEEHPLDVAYMQEDPVAMLNHYAPTEVREAPLRSLVLSVPHILKSAFIHYVVLLLEVFGRISRQVLTSHWTKIEAALKELQGVLALWKRMLPGSWGESRDISGNEIPRLSPVYAVPAGILFVLRCRYWPTLGAHIWYHGWGQFNYAWKHPAAYVDLQNTLYSSFWSFLWSLLRFLVILGIGEAAVAYTKRPQGMEAVGWFGHATATYAVFHSLCSLDRSLFAIAAAVATLLSCAQLMFHDAETVAELFRASFFFWFALFFQFVVAMIQAGALEKGAGLWAIFGGAAVHVTVIVVCAVYYVPITGFFWACMKPARRLARWVWIHRLGASVVVAKGIGMALLIAAVWKAYWLMHKFVWDPYDIEDSLKKLLQTTRMVRETLGVNPSSKLVTAGATSTADLKRIGWYPLGTKRPRQAPQITPNDQPQPPATGPPPSRRPPTSRSLTTLSQASTLVGESLSSSSASTAGATTGATTPSAAVAGDNPTAFSESLQARGSALAATPMHATSRSAHEAFSREAGQAVDGLREYLASPSGLKRDASLLGRKLDDAVVASGEGIGRAVDWGLESVGGAVGKVGEVGGRLMLEAGSKIGEVGGRLMLEAGDKMSEAALVVRDERVGKLKEE